MNLKKLNDEVKIFWEKEPCGTGSTIVGKLEPLTLEWFEAIEKYRYEIEPCIYSIAQFSQYYGKKILEVGVGAGTDHLQWARSGAECFGVDLTDAAIEATRIRFNMYGFKTNLQRQDAETLPFSDNFFDVVYSWGVIHHSQSPELIVKEILRVLKPGGLFIGMVYGRRSPLAFKFWVKYGLLKGKFWKNFADIIWDKVESIGTKAYTKTEIRKMLIEFSHVDFKQLITKHDTDNYPRWMSQFFPDDWGWFIGIRAKK